MSKAFKILPFNYLADWGEFEAWPNGTMPAGWLVSTAGTYSQETTNKKYGSYGLGIVASTNILFAGLYRTIPDSSDYNGRTFTFGAWVKANTLKPYISLNDGVGFATAVLTATNTWQELKITRKLDYATTQIRLDLVSLDQATAYFDSGYLVEGEDSFTNFDTNIDISTWQPALGIKSDQFEIARKEGSYIPEYHLQNETIKVSGNVIGTDVQSCRTHFDGLIKSLMSWQKTEKRHLYLYDDRVLDVFLKSFDWNYVNGVQMIKFNMQFSAPDATTRGLGKLRKRQVISGTVTEFNLSYNGNAESKPIVTFIADQAVAIATCSLENLTTGENLAYVGTVPTNATLDIDCDTSEVLNNGVDSLVSFSGDFLKLVRGTNYFRFSGSNCTIYIDYYERYY